jgi:sugar transferase (PEP-CTERM/EpsH1 system associated)
MGSGEPMAKVLFLAHRIPYPPNKGDKIRVFHVLKHIAAKHEVFLGTLTDDPQDRTFASSLTPFTRDVFTARIGRGKRLGLQATAAITGLPLSVASFQSRSLARWVEMVVKVNQPGTIYVSSSAMFEYVRMFRSKATRLIVDFMDVDSEKWRQYAGLRSPPLSWVFAEEARRLSRYDRAVAEAADASIFVSESERDLFAKLAPAAHNKLHAIPNGVDASYFAPPPPPSNVARDNIIVFTGAMDYWPNIDAVAWFAGAVLPIVREQLPETRFLIVGARPAREVLDLRELPGVEVTGAVPDVRPYLAKAKVVVAPLRVARGIQNKVLEGMSMAKPVITSPQALEGIGAIHRRQILVADNESAFAESTLSLLRGDDRDLGERARDFVLTHHDWSANLKTLDRLIDGDLGPLSHHTHSTETGADELRDGVGDRERQPAP